MEEYIQLTALYNKINANLSNTQCNIENLGSDMNRIINQVTSAVETTAATINNGNLQSMDKNFAENMDLMQR